MNIVSRFIWVLLNIFLGAGLAYLLFYWAACDLQIPLIVQNFLSTYLPFASPLFNVPYVKIQTFSSSLIAKLIFNGFLYAIFGVVHTLFAQEFVQDLLARYLFPKQALRTVYCILVTITVFIMMGFWQHTNIQLWNFLPSTMSDYQKHIFLIITYQIIDAPGWYVVIKFDPFEFGGLKQLFRKFQCPYSSSNKSEIRTTGCQTLVTTGLFRYCRHPLYTFTLLALILTPVMSLDHLAFVFYTIAYALIAIPIEERKLINIFGQSYIDYQKRVPAIFPFWVPKQKQN